MTKAILGDHLEGAWDTQAEYTEKADTHHNNEQTKKRWFKYTQIQRQSARSGNRRVTHLKLIRD